MVKIRHLGRALLGLAALFAVSSVPASAGLGDALDRSGWTAYVSSNETGTTYGDNGGPTTIIDGDASTFWHSDYDSNPAGSNALPEWILIDMGSSQEIGGISYTPRSNAGNGTITGCDIFVGDFSSLVQYAQSTSHRTQAQTLIDGKSSDSRYVGSYTWASNSSTKQAEFTEAKTGQYVLVIITSAVGSYFGSCAELNAYSFVNTAEVTYNYYINSKSDGNLYKTDATGTVTVGSTITVPAVAFTTITSSSATQNGTELDMTAAVSSTDAITVDVICQEALPFKVSDDNNTYYYALDIHSDDTWGINRYSNSFFVKGEESTVIASTSDIIAYSSNAVPAAAYQWVIQGNLINGFTLYNPSAAKYITVETGNTENQATLSETPSTFKIAKSSITDTNIPNISDAFCLYIEGNTSNGSIIYLNHRDGDNGGVIKGWTSTDGGSTIIARPLSFFPQTYYNKVITACNSDIPSSSVPTNAYGIRTTAAIDYSAATPAYNASTAAPLDDNATTALIAANSEVKTTIDAIAYNPVPSDYTAGYYRLYNYAENKYLTYSGDYMNDQESGTSVGSVFKFVATDTEGQYYMNVEGVNIGQFYRQHASSLASGATAAEVTLSQTSGIYKIQDVSTASGTDASCRYLHVNSGNATGWYASSISNNPPSFWYLVPADIAEVSLNTVGEASYATTCLPFGVSSVSGATPYIGAYNDDKTKINATATTDGTIPANTGVILVGAQDATAATLTIGTATDVTGNVLSGTCVAITNDSYLTFGRIKGQESTATEPGFYLYTGTTIPANKAYLVKTAAETVRLNFGDATTGIDAATIFGGESNAPVYDLSGRRVATPVKGGIYLQGGKKFIK